MSLDRISEEISHFIGLFQLEIESNRLRLDYEAFTIERDKQEREPKEKPDLEVAAPFSLKGFDPGLVYMSLPAKIVGQVHQSFKADTASVEVPPLPPLELTRDEPEEGWTLTGREIEGSLEAPPPNSIVLLVQQIAELSDNDVLLVTGETDFETIDALISDFLELIDQAGGLSAAADAIADLPLVPSHDAALSLAEKMSDFAPDDGPAEIQLVLRGEDAEGVYLNGVSLASGGSEGTVAAEDEKAGSAEIEAAKADGALPDFTDLLPEYLAGDPGTDDPEASKDALAMPSDGTTDPLDSPYAVDDGTMIVTGANLVTNEASITQKWVDAPVIAVAGDAIRLDMVSQVNAMSTAPATSDDPTVLPSKILNGVAIERESASAKGDQSEAGTGVFPETWTVVDIAADVVAVNWVQQHVFATDFDRAEVSVSASDTFVSMGENIVGNAAKVVELGFHYDLILVGGDMVTMNVVDQVNVLLDIDTVGGDAPAGPEVLKAGDNLQYNRAELKQTGIDEVTALDPTFDDALREMADGKEELAREIAEDARFEGKEALKVLRIEGDLIKANIVQQYNYLGDSDQIELMLDEVMAAGNSLKMVTGSNAQLNAATLHDVGLDSEVMVGGDAYSDALLHQVGLMDADAPPSGVNLEPLTNEAVAFLVDDMLETAPDHDLATNSDAEHPAVSDVMGAIVT